MGMFDAANPDDRKKRNQRKDGSVVEKMKKSSEQVHPPAQLDDLVGRQDQLEAASLRRWFGLEFSSVDVFSLGSNNSQSNDRRPNRSPPRLNTSTELHLSTDPRMRTRTRSMRTSGRKRSVVVEQPVNSQLHPVHQEAHLIRLLHCHDISLSRSKEDLAGVRMGGWWLCSLGDWVTLHIHDAKTTTSRHRGRGGVCS